MRRLHWLARGPTAAPGCFSWPRPAGRQGVLGSLRLQQRRQCEGEAWKKSPVLWRVTCPRDARIRKKAHACARAELRVVVDAQIRREQVLRNKRPPGRGGPVQLTCIAEAATNDAGNGGGGGRTTSSTPGGRARGCTFMGSGVTGERTSRSQHLQSDAWATPGCSCVLRSCSQQHAARTRPSKRHWKSTPPGLAKPSVAAIRTAASGRVTTASL